MQIDHMSVPIRGTGKTIKHFDAICPVSIIAVSSAHTTASSRAAASFLEDVIHRLPVRLKSIQVDGGSEFMKEFEKACESKGDRAVCAAYPIAQVMVVLNDATEG